jgi:hypothetical protein
METKPVPVSSPALSTPAGTPCTTIQTNETTTSSPTTTAAMVIMALIRRRPTTVIAMLTAAAPITAGTVATEGTTPCRDWAPTTRLEM